MLLDEPGPDDLPGGSDMTAARGTTITVELAYRPPFAAEHLLAFLTARAVPGLEVAQPGTYRRSLGLPHGQGTAELSPADGHVACTLRLDDGRDLAAAVHRCRCLLDLEADPAAVDAALGADPALAPLVGAAPGLRVPGTVDGAELAVRAVLGQQVSVAGARTLTGRLVAALGEPLVRPHGTLTHLFPSPAALAGAADADLPMPAARRRAVRVLATALASGDLVIGGTTPADRAELRARLLALPGIGPWTAAYVALRATADPDVFLPTDLGVRRALERLGHDPGSTAATRLAERWRPWRSYALLHLWTSLAGPLPGHGPEPRSAPGREVAST